MTGLRGRAPLTVVPAPAQSPVHQADSAAACATRPACQADPEWLATSRRARALSWVSLVWMSGEGVVGLAAGLTAASVSLIGWALGSIIEGLASMIVIWRFTGIRTLSETAEGRAQKAVAVSFCLLALYITV